MSSAFVAHDAREFCARYFSDFIAAPFSARLHAPLQDRADVPLPRFTRRFAIRRLRCWFVTRHAALFPPDALPPAPRHMPPAPSRRDAYARFIIVFSLLSLIITYFQPDADAASVARATPLAATRMPVRRYGAAAMLREAAMAQALRAVRW